MRTPPVRLPCDRWCAWQRPNWQKPACGVNAVSPGPIETPLYGKLGMSAEVVQGFAQALTAQIPLRRFGTPDEVAKAALFLASDDSSFMTGEEIVLDGGMTRV